MKIGFIGAGRMGFTMGRHLADYSRSFHGASAEKIEVAGYYSKTLDSAKCAAEFTDTKYYEELSELVRECDMLFITTPDDRIEETAGRIKGMLSDERETIMIHTSGALSSQVFSGMGSNVYGYSVHPIYAVNSKIESYINFREAFITIEGHEKYIGMLEALFTEIGHSVKVISPENKAKYHGAAVFASNLVEGLFYTASNLLRECGFEEEEASRAIMPLFINNAKNIYEKGCRDALTGPVARNDVDTVRKHLSVMENDDREIYRLLSKKLVDIVTADGGDYDELNNTLK